MKVIVILAALVVAACGASSTPGAPAGPSFVVVSTDWRQTMIDPVQQPRQDCSAAGCWPTYQYTAHGIFRNQGASGSATVTFSDAEGNSCNTVINAQAGQVVEASCPLFESPATVPAPPTTKVSQ